MKARADEIGFELQKRSGIALRKARIGCLRALNVLSRKSPAPPPRNTPVVVSLTTYPGRLESVWATIETILRQRAAPDAVVLWLSEQEIAERDLPPALLRQRKRGLEVRFVPENYRSYKKLIYAVRHYPEAAIVTADDDVLYPATWLGGLLQRYREDAPAIICYRARRISYGPDGSLLPYEQWPLDNEILEDSMSLMPIGVSGILYPPGSLDPTLFDPDSFMRICPTGDDIWFRAMTLAAGVPCRKVLKASVHFPTIPGSQESSLFSVNREARTDQQIRDVFDVFRIPMQAQPPRNQSRTKTS